MTAYNKHKMKWWGWGRETEEYNLKGLPAAQSFLKDRLSLDQFQYNDKIEFDQISLKQAVISDEALAAIEAVIGKEHCHRSKKERLLHTYGKSYKDLFRMRQGLIAEAPDLVVYPDSTEQIQNLLSTCAKYQIAVIPFGGGSSVVGGLEPLKGTCQSLIVVDMARLKRVLRIDKVSLLAVVEAGIFGPDLEDALAAVGFTLGHFPQSFEFSTLGGWIAARSSGQNSLRYGGIEKLLHSVDIITPIGQIETRRVPRRSDGPDLKEIILGSEGTLGIITQATVRIKPLPDHKEYFAVAFRNFFVASEAARQIIQAGVGPAMLRISDEQESQGSFHLSRSAKHSKLKVGIEDLVLKTLGYYPPRLAVMIVGLEGDRHENLQKKRAVYRILRNHKHLKLGKSPGRHWLSNRFRLPYLRDALMDHGIMIDTLETATNWVSLPQLYEAVQTAIQDACKGEGIANILFCHISHLYQDGASLYFTFITPEGPSPLRRWAVIKEAANQAIAAQGAAISHHHGVGLDHKQHVGWGQVGDAVMQAVKTAVDPTRCLNPGKLL